MRILIAAAAVMLSGLFAHAADDKYIGYYYPDVISEETFSRKLAASPPSSKAIRVNFVTLITKAQLSAPESPRFVVFAKGKTADQLIMIALDDEIFKTPYRARAVLAQMTSNLRSTDFFAQQNMQTAGTFFDMLQILDFTSLVISDGETWSHKINFER